MDILRNPPGWGSLLGQGIGEGLQLLADSKLKQMGAQQRMQGLKSLGFTDQEAQALSPLSDSLLQPIIKQKMQAPASAFYQSEVDRITGRPAGTDVGVGALSSPLGGPTGNVSQNLMSVPSAFGSDIGTAPTQQPMQRPMPPISDRQKYELGNLQMKADSRAEKLAREDRKYYTDLNQKKVDAIESEYDPAIKFIDQANRSLALLKSGKFSVGPLEGRITQGLLNFIENPEATEYSQELNDFITQTYGDTKGVKSKAFLDTLKQAKAKFTDPIKAQEYFWNKQIKERLPKLYKKYALEDIKEGTGIGKDFESQFNKLKHTYSTMPKDLPNPQTLSEDTQFEDEKTKIIWGIKNGRWYPVGKGL